MKESPIPFNEPMVRASQSGLKTQTRRVVKAVRQNNTLLIGKYSKTIMHVLDERLPCPYGQPGDRLWVREAWRVHKDADHLPPRDLPRALTIRYEADHMRDAECGKYRPPMFMPRWACRLVLEIRSVRVERLQDISEADCIAEGCPGGHGAIIGYPYHATPFEHFRWVWEQCYGKESWDANPFVWVLEYRRA